ncbi:hypothetical protein FB451DRAFT_1171408 [Mycena latifolia]|nr:hypothetical protein FB451DRAFT_1171408 [Mycena latifolia]
MVDDSFALLLLMLRNMAEDGLRARPVLPLADLLWSGTAQMMPCTLCVLSAVRGAKSSGAGDLAHAFGRGSRVLRVRAGLAAVRAQDAVCCCERIRATLHILRRWVWALGLGAKSLFSVIAISLLRPSSVSLRPQNTWRSWDFVEERKRDIDLARISVAKLNAGTARFRVR